MDFDQVNVNEIIGYVIAALGGSVATYFRKMRRDITAAHVKIRKLENHLGLNGPDRRDLKNGSDSGKTD